MTVVGTAVTLVSAYIALRNVDFSEVWSTSRRATTGGWPRLAVMGAGRPRPCASLALPVRCRAPAGPLAPLRGAPHRALLQHGAPGACRRPRACGAINLRAGTSKAEALATVVVERAFDVLALLLLLFVALPWLPEVTWVRTAAIVAVVLGIGFAVCVVVLTVYGERPLRCC